MKPNTYCSLKVKHSCDYDHHRYSFASLPLHPFLHCVSLFWLRNCSFEFHWFDTGVLFPSKSGMFKSLGEWVGWGGPWLSAEVFSLPVGGNTTCQNTALACPGFLLYRWGLDSLWAPCHGSKPILSLTEPRIIQELVFFFFILSTNQSTANSVSNFWTRCRE